MKPHFFLSVMITLVMIACSSAAFADPSLYSTSNLILETKRLEDKIAKCKENISYLEEQIKACEDSKGVGFIASIYFGQKDSLEEKKQCLADAQKEYNAYKKELNKRLGTLALSDHEREQKQELEGLRERSRRMQVGLNEAHEDLKKLSERFAMIPAPSTSTRVPAEHSR